MDVLYLDKVRFDGFDVNKAKLIEFYKAQSKEFNLHLIMPKDVVFENAEKVLHDLFSPDFFVHDFKHEKYIIVRWHNGQRACKQCFSLREDVAR
uniref:DUF4325 domain-containing protein n=1 Tax=Panagrellus redivivus TaxID=6233 RepID=A0A7E4V675_PANRE